MNQQANITRLLINIVLSSREFFSKLVKGLRLQIATTRLSAFRLQRETVERLPNSQLRQRKRLST